MDGVHVDKIWIIGVFFVGLGDFLEGVFKDVKAGLNVGFEEVENLLVLVLF